MTRGGEAGAGPPGSPGRRAGGLPSGLPTIEVSRERLDAGVPVYDLMREAGLVTSNGEARRLIRGGGARVNDRPVRDETGAVGSGDLTDDGAIKLSAGRKRHALVRLSPSRPPAPRTG